MVALRFFLEFFFLIFFFWIPSCCGYFAACDITSVIHSELVCVTNRQTDYLTNRLTNQFLELPLQLKIQNFVLSLTAGLMRHFVFRWRTSKKIQNFVLSLNNEIFFLFLIFSLYLTSPIWANWRQHQLSFLHLEEKA